MGDNSEKRKQTVADRARIKKERAARKSATGMTGAAGPGMTVPLGGDDPTGLTNKFEFDVMGVLARTRAEARPYQKRIIHKIVHGFTPPEQGGKGLKSILVNSPTGSGKTTLSLISIKALQERTGAIVAWFSMRRNLLTQARKENAPHHPENNPTGKNICADVWFLSIFDKNIPDELLPGVRDKPLLLVHDEAQHDAANSAAHQHAKLHPEMVLGLSATPFRTDRMKLCFDTVIADAGLGKLIAEGYLSPFNHYTIPRWGVKETTECYLREPERWGKSIFYFHTVQQCHKAAEIIAAAGVSVDVVTGSTNKEEQIQSFRDGHTRVLVNCMVLTEGLDVPDLQTVFCRDSCKGVTIQMCGRAFRRHKDVPVKNIVQSQETKWPFVKTAEPVESYRWEAPKYEEVVTGSGRKAVRTRVTVREGMWLSLKPNPRIAELQTKMIHAMMLSTATMPKFISDHKFTKRGRNKRKKVL